MGFIFISVIPLLLRGWVFILLFGYGSIEWPVTDEAGPAKAVAAISVAVAAVAKETCGNRLEQSKAPAGTAVPAGI